MLVKKKSIYSDDICTDFKGKKLKEFCDACTTAYNCAKSNRSYSMKKTKKDQISCNDGGVQFKEYATKTRQNFQSEMKKLGSPNKQKIIFTDGINRLPKHHKIEAIKLVRENMHSEIEAEICAKLAEELQR